MLQPKPVPHPESCGYTGTTQMRNALPFLVTYGVLVRSQSAVPDTRPTGLLLCG